MNLVEYIHLIRRNWLMFPIGLLVCATTMAGYSSLQAPTYSSTAKVFVSVDQAVSAQDLNQASAFTAQAIQSYAEVASTPIVLEPVIARLGLDTSASRLAARVSASAPTNTAVLNITVEESSPKLAADVANAISSRLSEVVDTLTPASASGKPPVKITLLQYAAPSLVPISPRTSLNIVIGAVAGLVLALLVAITRSKLDVKIRTGRELEEFASAPLLGVTHFDSKATQRPLVVLSDPHSTGAESYRSLRTNLQYATFNRQNAAFVVTSSVAGEGKSTTAANLALIVAQAGIQVLLIDGDLRRPMVASYLGIDSSIGLTDVLVGQARLEDAVQRVGQENLHVLPSGHTAPNPTELLQSSQMGELLDAAISKYGVVVIDGPPLLAVSDSAILARRTAGAVLVCASAKTSKPHLRAAAAVLEGVDAPVLGTILTMVRRGVGGEGYSYAGYSYAYQPTKKSAELPKRIETS